MKSRQQMESSLDADAAEWLVRLEDTDAADPELQTQFFAWLSQSPQHIKVFLDTAETFHQLDALDSQRRIDVHELLANRSADVILLRDGADLSPEPMPDAPHRRPRQWLTAAAVAAVAIIGLGAFLLTLNPFGPVIYATSVGEQRTVKLDDGSMLYLNTSSRAETHFSKRLREIRLLEGEALFVVEHDPRRPFLVSTGGATVRAVGTQFNVHRDGDATRVSVVEGVVQVTAGSADALALPESNTTRAISSADLPAFDAQDAAASTNLPKAAGKSRSTTITLTAGEEASVTGERVTKHSLPEVSDVVAWRERRLVFRDAPLSEVAAEFNRYNKMQIRVEGEPVRKKQLTAIFSADHPQSVILYLTKDASLAVEPDGNTWVVRER